MRKIMLLIGICVLAACKTETDEHTPLAQPLPSRHSGHHSHEPYKPIPIRTVSISTSDPAPVTASLSVGFAVTKQITPPAFGQYWTADIPIDSTVIVAQLDNLTYCLSLIKLESEKLNLPCDRRYAGLLALASLRTTSPDLLNPVTVYQAGLMLDQSTPSLTMEWASVIVDLADAISQSKELTSPQSSLHWLAYAISRFSSPTGDVSLDDIKGAVYDLFPDARFSNVVASSFARSDLSHSSLKDFYAGKATLRKPTPYMYRMTFRNENDRIVYSYPPFYTGDYRLFIDDSPTYYFSRLSTEKGRKRLSVYSANDANTVLFDMLVVNGQILADNPFTESNLTPGI